MEKKEWEMQGLNLRDNNRLYLTVNSIYMSILQLCVTRAYFNVPGKMKNVSGEIPSDLTILVL